MCICVRPAALSRQQIAVNHARTGLVRGRLVGELEQSVQLTLINASTRVSQRRSGR